MKIHATLVVALVAAAVFSQESKPAESAASAPAGHDLRISTAARTLLVEAAFTANGKLKVKTAANEIDVTVDQKGRARWVDEVGDGSAKVIVDKRTFLEVRVDDRGAPKDPGLEGLTVVFETENRKAKATVEGTRRMLATEIQSQLRQVEAIGLWTNLPRAVEVGARIPFHGDALLATLIASSGPVRGIEGDLVLDRVEMATRRAFLTGTIGFTEDVDEDGVKFTAKYRVALTLEVDVENREMVGASLSGSASVSAPAPIEMSGYVDVSSKATAKPVKDVAVAKAGKAAFRENLHRMWGMEMELLSAWLPTEVDSKATKKFLDSRVQPDLEIQIDLIDEKADPSSDEFIKSVRETLQKEDPKVKVTKASFPIGKGLTFERTMAGGRAVRAVVVPLGDRLVRAVLGGAPDAVRKAESEFKAMQNSMRKSKN